MSTQVEADPVDLDPTGTTGHEAATSSTPTEVPGVAPAALGTGAPGATPGRVGPAAAVAGLAATFTAMSAARPLAESSFLTHLATGRLILESGVPQSNPFLFTGTRFPVPSWWWSVAVAGAERVGGTGAIRLLTALLGGLLGALLVALVMRPTPGAGGGASTPTSATQPSDGLVRVAVPVALALLCTVEFLNARPHLAGFVLLAAALLSVVRSERSPWWLVPLFVVWVNTHGTWLYGVVAVCAVVGARALDDRAVRRRDATAVGAVLLGTLVGGALYPDRFALLLLPARQFGDPVEREALRSYEEWGSVGLDQWSAWPLLALAALALWGCRRERRPAGAVVVLASTVAGMSGLRMVPVAAIVVLPFAAEALRGVGSIGLPTGRTARRVAAVSGATGILLAVTCFTGSGYDLERFPVRAVDRLEERGLVAREDVRVLSHDYVGNYLEWRFGERANAFVDDRPDAATLLEYRRLLRMEPGWRDVLARSGADVVLWREDRPLADALEDEDGWRRAFRTDGFVVYCADSVARSCS